VYELLTGGGSTSIAKVRNKAGSNLWIVPSSIDLAAAEVELVSVVGREVILRDLLDQHAGGANGRIPQYDYVLMDCPPSLGVLTLNGLCAAKEVFIPLQPHYLALQGLGKLLETVSLVNRRISPDLKVTGIMVCMHDAGTKLAGEVIEDVRSFLESARNTRVPWAEAKLFNTFIRRNIKLAEAPSYGKSIFDYAADSNGAKDYELLAREVQGIAVAATPPAAVEAPVPVAAEPTHTPVMTNDEARMTNEKRMTKLE
jgi:chromosome partitioning protein